MPISLKDIPKFEQQNNISVSVYGYEEVDGEADDKVEGFVYPLRVAKEVKPKHADLLLIRDDNTSHYCLIRNFSRLILSQVSKYEHTHNYCRFCLHGFTRQDLLDAHPDECYVHGGQKRVFPENTTVEFTKIAKQLKAPFTVYADFESLLEEVNISSERTTKYQQHIACSYAYTIVSSVPGVSFQPKLYVGGNAAEHFLDSLQRDLDVIMPIINKEVKMIFDNAARIKFEAATHCHICEKTLDNSPVRDHDHFTGEFRGAAHKHCNLEYGIKRYKLHIFFHDLRGYDAHLIMQVVRSKHTMISF